MNGSNIEKGDVILCLRSEDTFAGCLMYVDEVKSWGVQAGMILPDGDTTYVRLPHGEYIRITDPESRMKVHVEEDDIDA